MGYFANGSEGDEYENQYCHRCVNFIDRFNCGSESCPVLDAHLLYNYEDCNSPESILHILIPRDEKGNNQQCTMFLEKTS